MSNKDLFEWFKLKNKRTAPIKWSSKLEIGYSVIDNQHKRLFALVKELHDIIHSDNRDQSAIERIAVSLRNYTIYHFGVEERILKMYNCPLYTAHKQEHATFVATVERTFPELISGDVLAQTQIHEFLLDWLVEHVRGSDKKWGDWIRHNHPNILDLD